MRGRVAAEEQDRFDAEEALWQLRIDLQLLTEGSGDLCCSSAPVHDPTFIFVITDNKMPDLDLHKSRAYDTF